MSYGYDPRQHWSAPEAGVGDHHHHAATQIGKLVRGGSARRIMEMRKAAKDKMRKQQVARKTQAKSLQEKHEDKTKKMEKNVPRVFDLSNQGDQANYIPDDYYSDEAPPSSGRSSTHDSDGLPRKHGKKDKKDKKDKKNKKKTREEEEAEEIAAENVSGELGGGQDLCDMYC